MSNGREIGTVVGSLVAAYFTGGASYAALAVAAGGAVGGAIGGAIDGPTRIQGQRLDDLKVQFSSYGAGIPILYGTERIAPNVIWSTDKIELATTTSAGKGASSETTNYKYYVHMRLLLCETPRNGDEVSLVQLFQDGKLIWDASSGIGIGAAIASAENPYATFTLYQGGPDQLPDGREESWTGGPGTAPAYRRVVSVLLTAVECPGGRIPQFSCVMSRGAQTEPTVQTGTSFVLPLGSVGFSTRSKTDQLPITIFTNDVTTVPGGYAKVVSVYALGEDYQTKVGSFTIPTMGGTVASMPGSADIDAICTKYLTVGGNNQGLLAVVDAFGGVKALNVGQEFADGPIANGYAGLMWGKWGDRVVCAEGTTSPYATGRVYLFDYTNGQLLASMTLPTLTRVFVTPSFVWFEHNNSPTSDFRMEVRSREDLTLLSSAPMPPGLSGANCVSPQANDTLYAVDLSPDTELWSIDSTGQGAFVCDGVGASFGNPYEPIGVSPNGASALNWSGNEADSFVRLLQFKNFTPVMAKAKDIIADQCQRSGQEFYDVSGIPDEDSVYGYKLATPASARANIDPLLTCFGIFAVDEDGQTKFKKLSSITSTASVTFDELCYAEAGSEPGSAMPLNRTQEIDLPRSVAVSYIEPTFDFQTATEIETRQVTDATEDTVVTLPIAISSDQAKRAAQTILYASWRSQNTRSCVVSRKFSGNSPGDGVSIESPRGKVGLWRLMSTNDTGAAIEWTLEPADADLFTQTAVGAIGYSGQQVQPLASPQQLSLVDGPIMRDSDNNAGLYAAMAPYGGSQTGAELFVGDDDSSLESRGTVENAAVIGFTENALANFSMNIMDEQSTLIVNVGSGELFSATRASLYGASTTNAAAIGSNGRIEIVQFLRASALGSGRYLLSGFLRGRRGTERNRSNHAANDRFVLMTLAGTLRPSMDVGSLGSIKSYRAISKGRSLNSATSQMYANTGEGLKPFAPWDARRTVASNNDQTMTWKRSTRMSSNALRGVLPLGEATEAYLVEFYTSSALTTLAGTMTGSTPTLTITSAQQIAFGLTPGATLYRRIYQLSDTVGRGAALEAIT